MRQKLKLFTVVALLILTLLVICLCPSTAGCVQNNRREERSVAKQAIAKVDEKHFKVYYDPKNQSRTFIYQGSLILLLFSIEGFHAQIKL